MSEVRNMRSLPLLTAGVLDNLIRSGYQYVQVRPITYDQKVDYLEPDVLLIIPFKEMPDNTANIEIYSEVTSHILQEWASFPNQGVKVLVGSAAWLK